MDDKATEHMVPTLGTTLSVKAVRLAILSPFQELGYDRPKEDQEAVAQF